MFSYIEFSRALGQSEALVTRMNSDGKTPWKETIAHWWLSVCVKHRAAMREAMSSTSAGPTLWVLKKLSAAFVISSANRLDSLVFSDKEENPGPCLTTLQCQYPFGM